MKYSSRPSEQIPNNHYRVQSQNFNITDNEMTINQGENLEKTKLEFGSIRLRLHNLQMNPNSLQNAVGNAAIHLFNLLMLLVYEPFSATSLVTPSSWGQVYRPLYSILWQKYYKSVGSYLHYSGFCVCGPTLEKQITCMRQKDRESERGESETKQDAYRFLK